MSFPASLTEIQCVEILYETLKKRVSYTIQTPILLFFFRSFSSAIGVLPPLSDLPGVSILTCGVPTLVGAFVAVPVVAVGGCSPCFVLSTSPDRDNMKDPGSPTNGLSSMNSSPYRERRLNDSANVLVSCTVEPVLLVVVPCKDVLPWDSPSGMGVLSSLLV